MRSNLVWLSIAVSLLSALVTVVLLREFNLSSALIPGMFGTMSFTFLIVALASIRRIEYVRFYSEGYGAIVLSLTRSGPEKDKFDGFVQQLVSEINASKTAHET